MDSLSPEKRLDRIKPHNVPKDQETQRQQTQNNDKNKISRGSILFSQMQKLTNRIKVIDNAQQKLIHDKILKNNSREGSVSSKKLDDSIHDPLVVQCARKIEVKEDNQHQCSMCKIKQQKIDQLLSKQRNLRKDLQNQQSQVMYLKFQLELLKEKDKNGSSKQSLDDLKVLVKKSLEKFMTEVVLQKLNGIDRSASNLNKSIQNLRFKCNLSSVSSQKSIKEQQKNKQVDKDLTIIKTQGETLMPASSSINLRKRSSTKVAQSNNEAARIKTLQSSLKDKIKKNSQLQKQLLISKRNHIDAVSEYQNRLQKLRKLNNGKDSPNGKIAGNLQGDVQLKLKQMQEKLVASQREYRKLNQRYLSIYRKQQQLTIQIQEYRVKASQFENHKQKYQSMQKDAILKIKQIQSARMHLIQQKDNNDRNILVIQKLKEKIQELEFQLSLKQEQLSHTSSNSTASNHQKSINFEKQFKIFEDNNNKLKGQIKRLNQSLTTKSKELETTHDQYRNQLFEKQKKLYELEMMLKEDFSKIRDSDYRFSRQSENSLMFSTTRMMSTERDIEFILTQGEIILPDAPNIEDIFVTKDFSKIQLDTHYDQQQFLKKISEYIDSIKSSSNRRQSKSRSRNSSQQKYKQQKRTNDLKVLVQNILTQVNRINREIPSLIKDQFFKLKSLLDKFRQQLNLVESNTYLLGELKQISVSMIKALMGERNSRKVDELLKNMKLLLKITSQ